ncbi:MAG: helix-turn-helix transcriptional regulator [Bacteroidales bacterium]|jgi:y4mF family transcriptional regulator|nr:helix-turn-helix transcriptional regulator [Bacteroidales bacterium]MBR6416712.1 helix-turn-helix transcriptional regulator [Bacteroidales bacterium]
METLGERIKRRRKMLQITQRQLADLSGIGINTLTKIERDEGNPTLGVINKVLDTLGMVLTARIKTIDEL